MSSHVIDMKYKLRLTSLTWKVVYRSREGFFDHSGARPVKRRQAWEIKRRLRLHGSRIIEKNEVLGCTSMLKAHVLLAV